VNLSAEVEAFAARHRACGELTGDATEPILTGYRVVILCPCGARFDRWITPGETTGDVVPGEWLVAASLPDDPAPERRAA